MKAQGVTSIVINVHHHAGQIIDFLESKDFFGLPIAISDEREELLETGGGIQDAVQVLHALKAHFGCGRNFQLDTMWYQCLLKNIQSIKNRIQNIETKLDNSENITSSSNTPTVNINQIISETFSLIRWAILISIGAIFGLRILGFLFRSADNWLNSSLQEGVMKRQREREEEMRKAERQREIT